MAARRRGFAAVLVVVVARRDVLLPWCLHTAPGSRQLAASPWHPRWTRVLAEPAIPPASSAASALLGVPMSASSFWPAMEAGINNARHTDDFVTDTGYGLMWRL
jgi:hypothetical protein